MPESHALLSASSAHWWLNCPPSAQASAGVRDEASQAALQGTACPGRAQTAANLEAPLQAPRLRVRGRRDGRLD